MSPLRELMLALLDKPLLAELRERRHLWDVDRHDSTAGGVPHLRPVGTHANLQLTLATVLEQPAAAHGLVPVLGGYETRSSPGVVLPDRSPRLRGERAAHPVLACDIGPNGKPKDRRLALFAADGVKEVIRVNPEAPLLPIEWLELADGTYQPLTKSQVLDADPVAIHAWLLTAMKRCPALPK